MHEKSRTKKTDLQQLQIRFQLTINLETHAQS
jgi:hypothetical protein